MADADPKLHEMEREHRRLTRVGFRLTIAWMVAIATLYVWRWEDMNLSEWGDFLAGVTAPIAFLWIILGYFQQRLELSQNTEALRLQWEELKNSVEEQRRMVDAAVRQASAGEAQLAGLRQQAIPQFEVLRVDRYESGDIGLPVVNHGGPILVADIGAYDANVGVEIEQSYVPTRIPVTIWLRSRSRDLVLNQIETPLLIRVRYTDQLGALGDRMYEFDGEALTERPRSIREMYDR